MAYPVIVPRESTEMESCRITRWYVKEGNRVKAGQLLCEVDTGKASFDIEAPADGLVLALFFTDDAEAPLLTPIAVIGEEGEEFEQFRQKPPPAGNKGRIAERIKRVDTDQSIKPEAPSAKGKSKTKITTSPRARTLAHRNNVPLSEVRGSGPQGAIIAEDVQKWIARHGIPKNGLNPEYGGTNG